MFKYIEKFVKGLFLIVSYRLCFELKNNVNWYDDKFFYFNWCIEVKFCWEVVL